MAKKTETLKSSRISAARQKTKAQKPTQVGNEKKEKPDAKIKISKKRKNSPLAKAIEESPKWKCVCGYEGDDFIHFRAVTWRTSSPSYSSDVYFPDQGVNFLVCPKCGTARCNIRVEGEYKYVKRANFLDPHADPWPIGWGRRGNSIY